MVPKLKLEHISLTSFSKMRVDLAAQVNNQCYNHIIVSLCMCLYQVLSESVSMALKITGGEEAEGTSKFADMMDKFFDCLTPSRLNF